MPENKEKYIVLDHIRCLELDLHWPYTCAKQMGGVMITHRELARIMDVLSLTKQYLEST